MKRKLSPVRMLAIAIVLFFISFGAEVEGTKAYAIPAGYEACYYTIYGQWEFGQYQLYWAEQCVYPGGSPGPIILLFPIG